MIRFSFFKEDSLKAYLNFFLITLAMLLLLSNLYGVLHGMRVAENVVDYHVRFENDLQLSETETLEQLEKKNDEKNHEFMIRANGVISRGMLHFHNWNLSDPDEFAQRVPFTENYILNALGYLQGLPQFTRYHFVDYKKSIHRGIGLCGDHTMILSQILDNYDIENNLVVFEQGHVVLEVKDKTLGTLVLDPDFGVYVNLNKMGIEDFEIMPLVLAAYSEAGYKQGDIDMIEHIYSGEQTLFPTVYSFMRMRYIFEPISYVLIWVLPLCLLVSVWLGNVTRVKRLFKPRHLSSLN